MNKKFLHSFRQRPSTEFSRSLKQRLDQMPAPAARPKPQSHRRVRLAQAFTIVAGLAILVLLAPPVFAQVVSQIDGVIQRFGNVTVKEVAVHPSILYAELEATNAAAIPSPESDASNEAEAIAGATETATPPTTHPDDCTELEPLRGQPLNGPVAEMAEEPSVTIVPHDCVNLESIIAQAGYDFSLPMLLPDGLWLESKVMVFSNEYGKAMTFFWRNADGNRPMHLDVSRAGQDNSILLAPGTYEKITVNGRPGIFIYGGWSNDINDWDRSIVRTIRWEQDGVMYNLVGFQHAESNIFISDVMLKQIAGSIE